MPKILSIKKPVKTCLQMLKINSFIMSILLSLKIVILVFLLIFTQVKFLYAQEDCALSLIKAQKLFDEGVIEEVPGTLAPCLNSGFSKEEKVSAYKLLVLTFLFEDRLNDAQNAMLKLLNRS